MYLFSDEEYNIFSKDYMNSNTKYVRSVRKVIQDKLLNIHDDIKSELISRFDLNAHWNPKNTTSLTFPCLFNKCAVNWLGLRYGRSKRAVSFLNEMRNVKEDTYIGFQKYACLQVNIAESGINIGLWLSVPKDGVDRMWVHQNIDDLQNIITKHYIMLRDFGFVWYIDGDEKHEGNYSFDFSDKNNTPEKFVEFFKKYDMDGYYSYCVKHIFKKSLELSSDELFKKTILMYFENLFGLYDDLIWKPKINE